MNEIFVAVRMDCEGKRILVRGENNDKEISLSFEIVKVYSVKGRRRYLVNSFVCESFPRMTRPVFEYRTMPQDLRRHRVFLHLRDPRKMVEPF